MDILEETGVKRQMDMIESYKKQLIFEMKKQGASLEDLKLVKDATIRNAIRNERSPEDVAWALLQ